MPPRANTQTRRSNFAAGCLRIRCRYSGASAPIMRWAAITSESILTVGRSFCRGDCASPPDRRFATPKQGVSAGTDPGARPASTRSNFCVSDLPWTTAHGSLDPSGDWQSRGYALVGTLKRDFAHPAGGFREDREGRLTLRANPHMHLPIECYPGGVRRRRS